MVDQATPASPLRRGRLAGKVQTLSQLDWDRLMPDPARWVAGVLAVLGLLALRQPLEVMMSWWWNNSNWNHGFIVPLFALYLLHVRREKLADFSGHPSWMGVGLVVLTLLINVVGSVYMFGMVTWIAVWIMAIALVWTAGGWGLVWRASVPLGYLLLAIPWSDRIYTAVTMPMRFFASQATGLLLSLIPGLTVQVNGVVLELTREGKTHTLNVADACAGMHMLVTLVALAVAVAFIVERPIWQRIVLIVVGVPIAIVSNVIRVFITALIHVYLGSQYAEGQWHTMLGLAMLPIALGMLLGVQWLLEHLTETVTVEVSTPTAAAGQWTLPAASPTSVATQAEEALPPSTSDKAVPNAVSSSATASQVRMSSPPILSAAVILGVFAIGWAPTLKMLEMYLTKEPIPLVRPLDTFPTDARMAPFTILEKIKLPEQMVETLGTKDYICWQWADNRPNRPGTMLQSSLSFFVSYDTGKQDSVPHVPDECYLGGGYLPVLSGTETLHLTGLGLPEDKLDVQLRGFHSDKMPARQVRYVMYVFNINNRWISSRTDARLTLNWADKYFFRSKVELSVMGMENAEKEALQLFQNFLQKSLPILVADYWPNVKTGPATQPVSH